MTKEEYINKCNSVLNPLGFSILSRIDCFNGLPTLNYCKDGSDVNNSCTVKCYFKYGTYHEIRVEVSSPIMLFFSFVKTTDFQLTCPHLGNVIKTIQSYYNAIVESDKTCVL